MATREGIVSAPLRTALHIPTRLHMQWRIMNNIAPPPVDAKQKKIKYHFSGVLGRMEITHSQWKLALGRCQALLLEEGGPAGDRNLLLFYQKHNLASPSNKDKQNFIAAVFNFAGFALPSAKSKQKMKMKRRREIVEASASSSSEIDSSSDSSSSSDSPKKQVLASPRYFLWVMMSPAREFVSPSASRTSINESSRKK